jgi:chromosome segregation ATPase
VDAGTAGIMTTGLTVFGSAVVASIGIYSRQRTTDDPDDRRAEAAERRTDTAERRTDTAERRADALQRRADALQERLDGMESREQEHLQAIALAHLELGRVERELRDTQDRISELTGAPLDRRTVDHAERDGL